MYALKKIGKVLTSKSVGTGPSSYDKRNLPDRGLTKVEKHWSRSHTHTHTHEASQSVVLLWTSDQHVTETST